MLWHRRPEGPVRAPKTGRVALKSTCDRTANGKSEMVAGTCKHHCLLLVARAEQERNTLEARYGLRRQKFWRSVSAAGRVDPPSAAHGPNRAALPERLSDGRGWS